MALVTLAGPEDTGAWGAPKPVGVCDGVAGFAAAEPPLDDAPPAVLCSSDPEVEVLFIGFTRFSMSAVTALVLSILTDARRVDARGPIWPAYPMFLMRNS